MYVGLVTALVGIALVIGSAVALAGPAIFVIAIDRAFIAREERTLDGLFGRDYIDYKKRVRRWVSANKRQATSLFC
jgi:protein-S-isoprenylcysteine O-methyltransferase Ste14